MADLFIIGRYEGVAGTTAVAVGSQVMHMLTVMIVGLAMGTTVSIARAIGADDRPQAAAATGNTVTLFLSLSLVLTAGLLLLRRPITAVMSTPEAAVEGTVRYLTICFLGIPCITAYNILSAIFRGMGDSKSPMIFIFIAYLANIALDYLFIGALHLGPAGAALGTSLSQAIGMACGFGAVTVLAVQCIAEPLVGLFTPDQAAVLAGGQYLRGYIWDSFFAGVQFSFSGYFCACGRSGLSFLHNFLSIVCVRIPGAYLTSRLFPQTLLPMGLANAAGSLFSICARWICPCRLFWLGQTLRITDCSQLELPTIQLAREQTEALIFLGKIGVSVSEEHLRAGDFSQYDGMFLAPDGFSREITLIDYGLTNDTEKFVTEITIPVREA